MIRPNATPHEISSKIAALYSLEVVNIHRLDGYDDLNYYVECKSSSQGALCKYVCKILNDEDSKSIEDIEIQHSMMIYLDEHGIRTPSPVPNRESKYFSIETFKTTDHLFRLLTYVEGDRLERRAPSLVLYHNVGAFIGRLYSILKGFEDERLIPRKRPWMLANVPELLDYVHVVSNADHSQLVRQVVNDFVTRVLPLVPQLETGPAHGDLNENNLLVSGDEIVGLIDFSDICHAPYLFDIAMCLTYMIFHSMDVSVGREVLRGYQTFRKLPDVEIQLLKVCVCARLSQSLVLGLYSSLEDPGNDYILKTQTRGWKLLNELSTIDEDALRALWGLNK